jgi:hypothetical protein
VEVRAFSDAVAAFAATAVDNGFDLDAARADGYTDLASAVKDKAATIAGPIDEQCGVAFTLG